MHKYIPFILLAISLFFAEDSFAASLTVSDYPRQIQPGEVVKFKVSWSEIPVSKTHKLIVQLENKDVDPPIFIIKEILNFKSSDTIYVTLDIPKTIRLASGYRFLAAFISKKKGWDDVFITSDNVKDVEIGSPYKIEIVQYPKAVYRGSKAFVILSWKNIPVKSDYKIIAQLENKNVKPNVFVVNEIINFNSEDKKTITMHIPKNIKLGGGYRFVAAVLSKTKEWDGALTFVQGSDDVVVKDLP